MSKRLFAACAVVMLLVGNVATSASAQQPPVKLTELMREPIEGAAGREGVIYTADLPPAAENPRHSHPGQEFIHVMTGSIVIARDGQASQTVASGTTAMIAGGQIHSVRNASASEPARAVVFLIAEQGKPLRIPAP